VNGNYASLNEFFHQLQRLHLKWLNRRSQRPSYTLGRLLCSASALRTGATTNRRTPQILLGDRALLSLRAAASIHEEPGAGKLHAGICAGAVG
jgi:hypothetical protein